MKYEIQVEARSDFVPEQSDPHSSRYVFAYTITIRNTGSLPAQLLSRHWYITDADGNVQEVQGPGVLGQQPQLSPGEDYKYSSGAILTTPVGSMHGNYHMLSADGTEFPASIPAFRLANPELLH